ncbi:unnamed protein product, partial [Rotaria magnacalcarata]
MNDFVPHHQTTVANELLIDGPNQVILVADGAYLFCQKSSNSEFQRRTYSQHKHRHLVKPMVIIRDAPIPIRVNSILKIARNWLELELEL